ncbi:MAG TPA: rod shape-determining protein MreC [Anaerolineaceae bacterium]|jgi:rod shape-determining protein MreC
MNRLNSRSLRLAVLVIFIVGLLLLALGGYLTPLFRLTLNPIITVEAWLSSRYLAIHDMITVPKDVARLQQRNAELESQVTQLQAQVIELQQRISEAQVLYALLDFARSRPDNQYVAASVIGRDTNPFISYILIDQGSDAGLRHGMPVVTNQGLVGRIDAVTAGGARVQLVTDSASVVNVRLQSTQVEASMTASVTGELALQMVPTSASLSVGDVILTSGLGGSYPANIFIGQISSVRKRESDLSQTAIVQSVVDFVGLKAVLVITNFKPVDLNPLIPTPAK